MISKLQLKIVSDIVTFLATLYVVLFLIHNVAMAHLHIM